MKRADYKKVGYRNYVSDRLKHRGVFCISRKWVRWAKRYLHKQERRKNKEVDNGT